MDRGFDVEAAARTLSGRDAELRERRRLLHEHAAADCRRIIDFIVREFRPRRVVQWGSLLELERIDPADRDSILRRGKVVYERLG